MAPKRPAAPAAAPSGSASEASDAEADAPLHHPSSPSPSKAPPPPPNPNPNSSAAAPALVAEDSAAAGSDSGAAYDSDANHRPALRKAGAAASPSPSRKPRSPRPRSRSRSRSPDAASESDGAASDADPAAGDGADSADDGNALPLPPPRTSRGEAAAIKPLSSRPMDPPRRLMVPSFTEPRPKRPRSVAVPSSVEQLKRPSRLWSLADELVILRGLATYRARRGFLPGSMHDIAKLQGHIQSELSVQVTPTQVSDKVRRLKQKYNLLASRAKNGRDPDFPTPHDRSVYELGKRVWGPTNNAAGDGYEIVGVGGGGGESEEEREIGESDEDVESEGDERARKNRRLKPIAMANGNLTGFGPVNANSRREFDFEKGKDAYPYLWETVEDLSKEHLNGVAFKKAFELIEGPKARGMEEKLRKFRLTEIRHQLRRMELMKETVKMVLDALEG
ncbi:STOREKEEPER protein-like [Panicum virgatum]|uniref:Glabrous enhancer-binding protein-like DBD domain-containing protein n=1 Tax=Panicum virgatum TaxID=38727 RepID=A0A8T0VGH7_PANVG|nr:STOREKEEPER protein-like [Panicum virgatum]KAG2635372.1 hypothetical protein PVAP13_2NG350900 [Panicum virgatum]